MINTEFLQISDGTGDAVKATIQAPGRIIGATSLPVDTLAKWSAKYIVTTGTVGVDGFITAASMTVMRAHTTGGAIIIDGFEPGYTDIGNTAGQVAIIKPVTAHTEKVVLALDTLDAEVRTRDLENVFDFIASGGVWAGLSYGVNLNASMTALVGYQAGYRGTVAAITTRAFTASKDTYIDILRTNTQFVTTFTVVYTEVVNNAASPTLAANSVRLGIVVSGATSIAAVTSINQGQYDRVLPIAASIAYSCCDSLGNLICPRDPNRKVIGYRQVPSSQGSITAITDITGLSSLVMIPTGRSIKVTANISPSNSAAGTNTQMIFDYSGTVIGSASTIHSSANSNQANTAVAPYTATTTNPTIKIRAQTQLGGISSTNAGASNPAYMLIELN